MRGLQLLWHPTIGSLHIAVVVAILRRIQVSIHIHVGLIKGLMVSKQIMLLLLLLLLMHVHAAQLLVHPRSVSPLTQVLRSRQIEPLRETWL